MYKLRLIPQLKNNVVLHYKGDLQYHISSVAM